MKLTLSLVAALMAVTRGVKDDSLRVPESIDSDRALAKFALGDDYDDAMELPDLDREVLNGCLICTWIIRGDDCTGWGASKSKSKSKRRQRRDLEMTMIDSTPEQDREMLNGCILAALGFRPARQRRLAISAAQEFPDMDREMLNGCLICTWIIRGDDCTGRGKVSKSKSKSRRRRTSELAVSSPQQYDRELFSGCILAALGLGFTRD